MGALGRDLRDAFRSLRKSPGFTVTALATLAIAIGANTAIFSVASAALLRSLPFEDPGSLVLLYGNVERAAVERRGASYPDFLDWRREAAGAFSGMAAYWGDALTLYGESETEQLSVEVVSPSYFDLLGVRPLLGRSFATEDETPGAAGVALLGHALWQRRFGGDEAVTGRVLRLGGASYAVVGVLPAGFRGLTDGADLWVAVGSEVDPVDAANRGQRWFPVLARRSPGVGPEVAQAAITTVARRLENAFPVTNEKRGVEVAPLAGELLGDVRPHLALALGAVGVVLLLAAANVAGLALGRAEARGRELAIRTALGAGRAPLVRLLLVEGLLVALLAGALGTLLAGWMTDALLAASPVSLPGFVDVRLDRGVLAFTVGVSTLLGLFLGLAPAARSRVRELPASLREGVTRVTAGRRGAHLRGAIVVGEVALAAALLVAAGLLLRSLAAISAVDPGFRADGLLSLQVSLPPRVVADGEPQPPSALAVLDRLAGVAGVEAVGLGSDLPYGAASAVFYTVHGQPVDGAQTIPRAYWHQVTAGFFEALGLELVRGRGLLADEVERRAEVVVVSEAVADRFWPGQDPIGKRLKLGAPDSAQPWLEVVGVVGEARYRGLPRNPTADADLFLPFRADRETFALFVRSRLPAPTVLPAVRAAILEVEPQASLFDVAPMPERIAGQLARPRFAGTITGLLALVAVVLAAVGVYGVVSESVGGRTREIGIRVALGARPDAVVAMVLRQGLLLAACGLLLGAGAGFVAARAVRGLLYDVGPADPAALAAAPAVLLAAALLASWLPARHAARVDPVAALRRD